MSKIGALIDQWLFVIIGQAYEKIILKSLIYIYQ
jgi:hypothetical protein